MLCKPRSGFGQGGLAGADVAVKGQAGRERHVQGVLDGSGSLKKTGVSAMLGGGPRGIARQTIVIWQKEDGRMSAEGLREETLNQLEERAGDYEERSGCCAQGCLLALQEQFHLGDELTFKAATAMPGIALRGETCGAVIGGLMAIGLAYGRESLDDWEGFLRAIRPARRFCRRFEKEFGSMMCRDIVKLQCGRSFDLADPAESREFEESGGYQKCRVPPGKAARIAGEIIMEKENPT